MIARGLTIVIFCLGLAQPAAARDLTPAERESLPVAVDSFREALRHQDVLTISSLTPPRVTAVRAEHLGMTVPDMLKTMMQRTATTGAAVTVRSIVIHLDAARTAESADGEPYLLIPSEIVITFPEAGTLRERSHVLAFREEGRWRLLRLGDEQTRLLRLAYTKFQGVDLPESSVEKIGP